MPELPELPEPLMELARRIHQTYDPTVMRNTRPYEIACWLIANATQCGIFFYSRPDPGAGTPAEEPPTSEEDSKEENGSVSPE